MPPQSKHVFFIDAELSFLISENGKPRFEEQNTVDVWISILKRFEHAATWDFAELFSNVCHETIKLGANIKPALSKLAELSITG